MERGDIVKYNPTGEIGIVVWHNEKKNVIDIRLCDLSKGHKYIYDKNIKQFTILGDYKWEQ